uniref:Nudix hydrolase 20ic-like isoform X2 n=1 Tax=Rhizophora mucronata TaxID=61149 RepID=A0A2P2JK23_RHIMU
MVMPCNSGSYAHLFRHTFRFSLAFLCIPKTSNVTMSDFPMPSVTSGFSSLKYSSLSASVASSTITTSSSGGFTWDDAVRVSQPEYAPDSSSDLSGFFQKIKLCNRGFELQSEFVPFVVEGRIVGYIHHRFIEHLRRFKDVFVFLGSDSYGGRFGYYVTLDEMLKAPEDRTRAVGEVIKCLGEENLIPAVPCDIIIWCADLLFA